MINPISALTQLKTVSDNELLFNVYTGSADAYLNIEIANLKEKFSNDEFVSNLTESDLGSDMVLVALASDESEFAWMLTNEDWKVEDCIANLLNDLGEYLYNELN